MKYILFPLLLFSLGYNRSKAQNIAPEIARNYSDGVIRKVYDLVKQLDLNAQRQLIFAEFYKKEDTRMATAIKENGSAADISLLTGQLNNDFTALLTEKEFDRYYLKHELFFLDSIINVLHRLEPILQDARLAIEIAFLNKRRKTKAESMTHDFLQAIQNVLTDTVYYGHLYREEIDFMANEFVNNYPNRREYPKEYADTIMKEIKIDLMNRQRGLRVIDYVMPNPSKEKDSFRNAVLAKYSYVIRKAEISRGVKPPKTLFVTAYLNRFKLHLLKSEADSLLEYAVATERDSLIVKYNENPAPGDFKTFEKQTITRFIGQNKFPDVLACEYREKAEKWANEQWADMERFKITNGYEKNRTIKDLSQFQLRRLVSKEMFAKQPDMLEADMRSINKTKPVALNALEYVRKSTTGKDALQKGFTW